MSTFKGVLDEFPDIRIDYFCQSKDPDARAPLACFLTHIHSDHIQGLDGFYGGPFIHCSAATKELLLRLERRTHRWNHAKGVLEARKCQYAEKKNKLKVIPLETPTMVELSSERSVRVTLFDANHCPGAVMFLIEGDGKAVLYTGDIRAEPWWVDYLARHPVLIPYTTGIKRLDKIYLDTSFTAWGKINQLLLPKREGIRELIEKVGKYPEDTIFHLNAWTFGYEDVWVALAAAFNTQIHLSKYHFRIFTFIRSPEVYSNGPYLRGYKFGNADVVGCLTTNPDVRFHSCERRSGCPVLEGKKNVVWITPVVTHMGDLEVHEVGTGDLVAQDDLVLHDDHLQSLLDSLGQDIDPKVRELLQGARNTRKQALPLVLDDGQEADDLGLEKLVKVLSASVLNQDGDSNVTKEGHIADVSILASNGEFLPNKITFAYSRHSSHSELRDLVAAFRPRDIYPCVMDERCWDETKTMKYLFGDLCDGNEFVHDQEMGRKADEEMRIQEALEEEREKYEIQSQKMLERTQGESFIDMQLFKENFENSKRHHGSPEPYTKTKAFGSSTASSTPVPSRPTTPRPLKRPVQVDDDDDTPRPKKPNYSNGEFSSSPPLPPLPDIDPTLLTLTPLEKARMMGSSTASSSPQSSPIKPKPGRPVERVARIKEESPLHRRIKYEVDHARSDECFNASSKVQTIPHARQGSSTLMSGIVARQESMNQEEVQEAMKAALGMDGKSWWDVELSCTKEKWRYEEEIEL